MCNHFPLSLCIISFNLIHYLVSKDFYCFTIRSHQYLLEAEFNTSTFFLLCPFFLCKDNRKVLWNHEHLDGDEETWTFCLFVCFMSSFTEELVIQVLVAFLLAVGKWLKESTKGKMDLLCLVFQSAVRERHGERAYHSVLAGDWNIWFHWWD